MRITVLMGGPSSERDVSLAGAGHSNRRGAARARPRRRTPSTRVAGCSSPADEQQLLAGRVVGTAPPDEDGARPERTRHDRRGARVNSPLCPGRTCCFSGCTAGPGEDGTLQALLDLTGVPYTGSGHLASALGDGQGPLQAPVPRGRRPRRRLADGAGVRRRSPSRRLGFPVIVKPSKQGSTVGLTLVKTPAGLQRGDRQAARYDDEVMIEQFIAGRELTVGISGRRRACRLAKSSRSTRFTTTSASTRRAWRKRSFPGQAGCPRSGACRSRPLTAHRALKLRGYSRIDFRMTPTGTSSVSRRTRSRA